MKCSHCTVLPTSKATTLRFIFFSIALFMVQAKFVMFNNYCAIVWPKPPVDLPEHSLIYFVWTGHQAMEGFSNLKTWCLLEAFSSLYDMNLCKPCIGPSLWSLAPHAPSFSTLTPAEDASFPLLRFMFSFQLLNLCGVAAGSYFANHQFRKQGHLGGFYGQPIIYAFEGHLRSSMYLNVRSKVYIFPCWKGIPEGL